MFDPHPISRSLAEKEGSAVGSLRPDRPLVAWRTGWMSVGNIAEVFAKVLGTPLSDADIRALAACGCGYTDSLSHCRSFPLAFKPSESFPYLLKHTPQLQIETYSSSACNDLFWPP